MSLLDVLLSTTIITIFCLGFRTILSEGQILHFIRRPFEFEDSKMMNVFKWRMQKRFLSSEEDIIQIKRKYERHSNRLAVILKPLILCVICFSSAWGATIFLSLNGVDFIKELFISCISAAFLIKVINDKVDW